MDNTDRRYDEVVWGDTLCEHRCMRPAKLVYDGIALCIPCADDLLDRQVAVDIAPKLASRLPPLAE